MTRRLFIETEDWTSHDHAIARWLRSLETFAQITSSHAILIVPHYTRPSQTRIIKAKI